jgi:hypothetical protein
VTSCSQGERELAGFLNYPARANSRGSCFSRPSTIQVQDQDGDEDITMPLPESSRVIP